MVIASVTARYYEPASILLQLSLAKLYHIAIKKVNNNSRKDPRSKDNVQNNIITSNYVRAIADCLLILDIMHAVDFTEDTSMPGLVVSTNLFSCISTDQT